MKMMKRSFLILSFAQADDRVSLNVELVVCLLLRFLVSYDLMA